MGDDCSPFEKAKAAKVAHNIRMKRGKAEHGTITDGTFWSYLGGQGEISDESNHDPVQPLVRFFNSLCSLYFFFCCFFAWNLVL